MTIFILVNWFQWLNGYVIFIIWSEESFSRNVLKYLSKWKNSLVFKLYQNEILTILLNLQINILVHRQQGIDLDEGYLFWAVNTAGVSPKIYLWVFSFSNLHQNFFWKRPIKLFSNFFLDDVNYFLQMIKNLWCQRNRSSNLSLADEQVYFSQKKTTKKTTYPTAFLNKTIINKCSK